MHGVVADDQALGSVTHHVAASSSRSRSPHTLSSNLFSVSQAEHHRVRLNSNTQADVQSVRQVTSSSIHALPDEVSEDWGSVHDATTSPQRSLPSWFATTQASSRAASDASIYIEPVRSAMELSRCTVCAESFRAGQLRAGYVPCDAAPNVVRPQPLWAHAPLCLAALNLALNVAVSPSEVMRFSPCVSVASRRRILEELGGLGRHAPEPPRVQRRPLVRLRPWRYLPAVLQRWAVEPLATPGQASHEQTASTAEAPSLPQLERLTWVESDRSHTSLAAPQVREVIAQLLVEPAQPREAASKRSGLLDCMPLQTLENDEQDLCVICHDVMRAGEVARRLLCLHLFHQACVDPWVQMKGTCPLCLTNMESMPMPRHQIEGGEPGVAAGSRG